MLKQTEGRIIRSQDHPILVDLQSSSKTPDTSKRNVFYQSVCVESPLLPVEIWKLIVDMVLDISHEVCFTSELVTISLKNGKLYATRRQKGIIINGCPCYTFLNPTPVITFKESPVTSYSIREFNAILKRQHVFGVCKASSLVYEMLQVKIPLVSPIICNRLTRKLALSGVITRNTAELCGMNNYDTDFVWCK